MLRLMRTERFSGFVRRLTPAIWVVWIAFALAPLSDLLRSHTSALRLAAALVALAIFFGVYVWSACINPIARGFLRVPLDGDEDPRETSWWPIAVMLLVAVCVNLVYGSTWQGLYIYAAASVGPRFPASRGAGVVAAITALTATTGAIQQAGPAVTAPSCLLAGGIGISIVVLAQAMRTVHELRAARAEVARLAVAEERLRFARDLHDLLGHSLSLVALKCDLARQLLPTAPERALREIADAEAVARSALHEVREAVAGYRQTSLAEELAGAREVLAAAGIALRYDGASIPLPSAIEAVLAWTVREGITNVIRHSRARHCVIRLLHERDRIGIEIVDDGRSDESTVERDGGHGIAGLAERARALGGRCEAGPQAGGGFRLAVLLPNALPAHHTGGGGARVELSEARRA
jgi:two-component system sensor histidine kinase DesK